jgi:hypothetical protein
MSEYGVFNDEGCLARQFHTQEAADGEALGYRSSGDEPDAYAAEMCPDHADEEQPRDGCELCEEENCSNCGEPECEGSCDDCSEYSCDGCTCN